MAETEKYFTIKFTSRVIIQAPNIDKALKEIAKVSDEEFACRVLKNLMSVSVAGAKDEENERYEHKLKELGQRLKTFRDKAIIKYFGKENA